MKARGIICLWDEESCRMSVEIYVSFRKNRPRSSEDAAGEEEQQRESPFI